MPRVLHESASLYKGDRGEQLIVFWNWKWQDSPPYAPDNDNSGGPSKDCNEGTGAVTGGGLGLRGLQAPWP